MATDYQKAQDNYSRYSYARDNGHLDFVELAGKCDDYVLGKQWNDADKRRLERRGKPVITINKALPTLAAIVGEQLDNRADISFRPAKQGTPDTAMALEKIWLHVSNQNQLDWLEAQVAMDGFIRGRGFFDVRLDFNDQMQGEVRIDQLNSKNVVVDPDADHYDPDRWNEVFVTKWLSYNDIVVLYGEEYAKELMHRGGSQFQMQYDSVDWLPDRFGNGEPQQAFTSGYETKDRRMYRIIERQYRELRMQEHFVDMTSGDTRPVPEGWKRDKIKAVTQTYNLGVIKKRVADIKWTVSTDNILLHDAWSPYEHFTTVPYFPFFLHGRTTGMIENILPIQDLLNKTVSQELHIINTTANSGYKVKAGTLVNMTVQDLEERGGEDGLVVEVNDVSALEKFQPNQVPSGLDRITYIADEFLKEVSMVSDSMRGFDRADVAAKAIKAKQARGTVSLAMPFDNLAYTRKLLAKRVLDIVQSFYTEERVFNITGNNLTDEPEEIVVNQTTPEGTVVNDLTLGEYEVTLTLVPARDTLEQTQFQEAMEMRQAGVMIPDDVLVEHSHMLRKAEIAKRIKEMNGGGEMTEAQVQMQELEMQLKQIELQEKQADIALKQANAQLNQAKAAGEMADAQNGPNGEAKMAAEFQIEQAKLAQQQQLEAAKLAMEREQFAQKLALEKEKLVAELALKREQVQAETALKRETAAVDAQTKRDVAAVDVEVKRETAKQQQAQQKEQMKGDMAIKKEQVKAQTQIAKAKQRAQPKGAPSK